MSRMRTIAVILGALWGAACMIPRDVAIPVPDAGAGNENIHTVYEERYRVLFARDSGPVLDRIERDPEVAARRYRNIASLNTTIEELSAEGFTLAKVEPIISDGGATQFVFRRRIPDGFKPTNAPMEFTGLYRVEAQGDEPPIYYMLDPIPGGYRLLTLNDEGMYKVLTHWNGKNLSWRHENTEETITLSDDGRSIIHTSTEVMPTAVRLPHPVIREAMRVRD